MHVVSVVFPSSRIRSLAQGKGEQPFLANLVTSKRSAQQMGLISQPFTPLGSDHPPKRMEMTNCRELLDRGPTDGTVRGAQNHPATCDGNPAPHNGASVSTPRVAPCGPWYPLVTKHFGAAICPRDHGRWGTARSPSPTPKGEELHLAEKRAVASVGFGDCLAQSPLVLEQAALVPPAQRARRHVPDIEITLRKMQMVANRTFGRREGDGAGRPAFELRHIVSHRSVLTKLRENTFGSCAVAFFAGGLPSGERRLRSLFTRK
ncbi:hypothetical protein SKAU_G00363500 [Synaphobranchus kaupii]|uniref:Uncharacterized protein n=1 Tax=Synaphobranchus kaupii TaxID=118154 RepID=A0A9Q1EIT0_SYNKA|nr:hypothetical protein SKAU_G00363500 [Synaphobranchus kaupii]